MILFFALLAAVGCAAFNGTAAVLEKLGAGQEPRAKSSHPGLLWRLKGSLPYVIGITLDLLAWPLTLFAVHNLPLFLVQPIIACSVIVTVLIEYFVFKNKLGTKFIFSLLAILVGLVLLAYVSGTETTSAISHTTKWIIVFFPVVLVVFGSLFSTVEKNHSTYGLAAVSGIAFGSISIAGRAIIFSRPYIDVLSNPLLWATLVYGLIGILFFTIALQRASATTVNATMIACETLFPILVGLTLLGDHPRNNLWVVVVLGIVLAFSGTIMVALSEAGVAKKNTA